MSDEMLRSERTLNVWARLAVDKQFPGSRLVLLLDQFEELFTNCDDTAARDALIRNIMHACTAADGETITLLTLRADFYGECSVWPAFAAALSEHQFLVGPMQPDQLRACIERPAQMLGCEFEPGLVNLLVQDIREQPGALPLLQYTLSELWNERSGRRLTHGAYEKIGGVAGALETRAELLYAGFNEAEKLTCRQIFLQLSQPTEDGKQTRRRARMAELMPVQGNGLSFDAVIARLCGSEARLINVERIDGVETVDVSHEALIRNWGRLGRWLETDQEFQLWRKRLRSARDEWQRARRHPDSLLRGLVLEEARRWLEDRSRDLNREEREFVEASDSLDRIRREEEEARQRELKAEQQQRLEAERQRAELQTRAARRLRFFATGLAVLALTAAGAAIYAVRQAGFAASRELALAAVTAAGTEPELGVILAMHATAKSRTREAEEALHRAIQLASGARFVGHDAAVNAVSLSSDGRFLATAGQDMTARLWDLKTGAESRIVSKLEAAVLDVSFSPDGATLAFAAADGTIQICRIAATSEVVRSFPRQPASPMSVGFSPDGRSLGAAFWDGSARIFAVDSGAELAALLGHSAGVHRLAIGPDGQTAGTASADATAKLWDLRSGAVVHVLAGHKAPVTDIAFSRDGSRVATASLDGTARLWDARTGATQRSVSVHSLGVARVAFDSAGKRLATAGLDGKARLWDLNTGSELLAFWSAETRLTDVRFHPNAEQLLTAGAEGVVRIFDLDMSRLLDSARKLVAAESRTLSPEECDRYLHVSSCPPLP
jgi:hypothetical protein